jgi:hypothetical protein
MTNGALRRTSGLTHMMARPEERYRAGTTNNHTAAAQRERTQETTSDTKRNLRVEDGASLPKPRPKHNRHSCETTLKNHGMEQRNSYATKTARAVYEQIFGGRSRHGFPEARGPDRHTSALHRPNTVQVVLSQSLT